MSANKYERLAQDLSNQINQLSKYQFLLSQILLKKQTNIILVCYNFYQNNIKMSEQSKDGQWINKEIQLRKKYLLIYVRDQKAQTDQWHKDASRSKTFLNQVDQTDKSSSIQKIESYMKDLDERLQNYDKMLQQLQSRQNDIHQSELDQLEKQVEQLTKVKPFLDLKSVEEEVKSKLYEECYQEQLNAEQFLKEKVDQHFEEQKNDWMAAQKEQLSRNLTEKEETQIKEAVESEIRSAQKENQRLRDCIQAALNEMKKPITDPLQMNVKLKTLRDAINQFNRIYELWNQQKKEIMESKIQMAKYSYFNLLAKAMNYVRLRLKVRDETLIKQILQYRDYFYRKVYKATEYGFIEDPDKVVDVDEYAKYIEKKYKETFDKLKGDPQFLKDDNNISKAYKEYKEKKEFQGKQLISEDLFKKENEKNKLFDLQVFLDHFDTIVSNI